MELPLRIGSLSMTPGDEIKTVPLCCIVNPATGEEPDQSQRGYCWCAYCGFQICIETYLIDHYYHHEECSKVCSHNERFHDLARKERRLCER